MIGIVGVIAQLAIVAHGPEVASACRPFDLTVAVRAPGIVIPQITAPSLAPFDILGSSPSPHVTIEAGGGGSVLAEFRYILTTDQTGSFTIPAFEARLAQTVVRSQPLTIVVRGPRADNVPSIVTRARVDTGLDVNFRAIASPETVYVGQQVNYEVAVFLNENVRDRLRRNPTFYPPDIQSMLSYDLPVTGEEAPRRRVGSRCFETLLFQRALFPLVAGKFIIPPSQLVYSLSTSAGFFSREESHELQTESAQVVAVEPPSKTRPGDWTGAVGNLRLHAHLDTDVVRVGDPLVLTVQVAGAGNVNLFPRPEMHIPWAAVVSGDERVHVDSTTSRVSGSKEFDWVLTPRIAGELDIPPIHYSYFNPDQRRYADAEAAAPRVRVVDGALAKTDTVRVDETMPVRARYHGPTRVPLHEHLAFWLLVAAAPLPALGFRSRGRRRRVITVVSPSERLRRIAMPTAADRSNPPAVRRAFGDALGERLGLSSTVFTRPGALARALRRAGVSREVAEGCERLMRELDGAAYARDGILSANAADRALMLYGRVEDEALPRHEIRLPLSALGVILVAVLSTGVLSAAGPAQLGTGDEVPSPVATFDDGVSAYSRHDFAAARVAFREVARGEPRSSDAWANFGTAAWAGGDTADAVAGWQRALRLEPLAEDVRDRVQLARGVPVGSAGYVPPTPLSLVGGLAILLWIGGWIYAARREAQGLSIGGAIKTVIIIAAIGLVATLGLESQLAARRIAVVRNTTQLLDEPVLGSDRGPSALIGEVVRVRTVRGAWTLIGLDDGRDGWIDSNALISLDQRDSSGD